MEYMLALPTLLLVATAPFVALNAYLVVWICGPAIRRAGRCFEDGRIQARDARETRQQPAALLPQKFHPPTFPAVTVKVQDTPKPGPGRLSPADAGHRWLGDTGKNTA